jgi:alanyl-tRNA synthetase
MGLERVAAVLQGKLSNYDTDLIHPIIARAADMFGVDPTAPMRASIPRCVSRRPRPRHAFLIHDGVLPANDGRGYVLRKIMRRAMRHVRLIGVEEPFLYKLTGVRGRVDEARLSRADGERAARRAHRKG